MNQQTPSKVAFITGAAQGIGRGCAEVFARAGWRVALAELHQAKGQAAQEELRAAYPASAALFLLCDVRYEESVRETVKAAAEHFGRLDAIINNAGIHPAEGRIDHVPASEFDALIHTNLTSAYMVAQYALPHLRKTEGNIVNIASLAGVLGQGGAVAYSASKAGMIGMTKALAIDLAPGGIRVNAVCPAGVDTPMMHEWATGLNDYEAVIAHQHTMHKLGRMATTEEIARVCFFLASEDASFITGQAIIVDGGVTVGY